MLLVNDDIDHKDSNQRCEDVETIVKKENTSNSFSSYQVFSQSPYTCTYQKFCLEGSGIFFVQNSNSTFRSDVPTIVKLEQCS